MDSHFDEKLCREVHKTVDSNIVKLWEKYDEISECLDKKYNKIMAGIFTTLLTVIASLIIIIITKAK